MEARKIKVIGRNQFIISYKCNQRFFHRLTNVLEDFFRTVVYNLQTISVQTWANIQSFYLSKQNKTNVPLKETPKTSETSYKSRKRTSVWLHVTTFIMLHDISVCANDVTHSTVQSCQETFCRQTNVQSIQQYESTLSIINYTV